MLLRRSFPVLLFLGLSPAVVLADVVWPALYLEIRLFSWWVITTGLIAECVLVRWLFKLQFKRAAVATFAANAASSVAGVFLIPLAGFAWEFFPGPVYMNLLNWGTFNPVTWAATFLLACLVNTAIESVVYKRGFKLSAHRREFFWIYVANAVSVGLAFGSLFVYPLSL